MGRQIYKIVDEVFQLDEYLKSKEELDKDLVAELRNIYSEDAEFALINKGISDANDVDYVAYRNLVSELKVKRDAKLAENQAKLDNTQEVEYQDGDELRTVLVYNV